MAICKDCIHNEICKFYRELGITVLCYDCGYYKRAADVVPKSEVDLYRRQVDELEDELASTYDKLENAKSEVEKLQAEVERLQKENAELLLSETTELHLPMESLVKARVEHPIFKEIEGKVAWKIFEEFDKAIGACEAWDHLPAVLLRLLAELKQKYP